MTPVEKYDAVIGNAAASMSVGLRRKGWDVDDCKQEARLYLLSVPGFWAKVDQIEGEDAKTRMVYVAARRAVLRAARGPQPPDQIEESWLEQVESRGSFQTTVELADMVLVAPHPIARYLKLRLLDGMTWDETREAMEVCNTRLAQIRTDAANWMLTQIEGRK